MGMTTVEKTLAAASGKESVSVGDIVFAKWNFALSSNFIVPAIQDQFRKMNVRSINSPERLAIISDHFHYPANPSEAQFSKDTKEFAGDFNIEKFYSRSRSGVGYLQAAEEGWIVPGDVVIGTDSHTLTLGAIGAYGISVGATDLAVALTMGELWIEVPETVKVSFAGESSPLLTGKDLGFALLQKLDAGIALNRVIEIGGETVANLAISDRFALADTVALSGASGVLFQADREVLDFLSEHASRESQFHFADDDAYYPEEITIDVDELEPQVQRVNAERQIFGVSALAGKDTPIDTVVIGGCSGGMIEDLWKAAKVMKYRKVSENVNFIVIPATPTTYQKMVNEGLASIFIELGGEIQAPGSGSCSDNHRIFGAADDNILITSRGDISPKNGNGQIYSAGVSIAAATAIQGKLSDPRELIFESRPPESS